MPTSLKFVWIVATTADVADAGSSMYLMAAIPDSIYGESPIPSGTPGATTVTYLENSNYQPGTPPFIENLTPADIEISVDPPDENDLWLPQSFYVIGAEVLSQPQVIAAIPQWPADLWLGRPESTGPDRTVRISVTLQQVLDHLSSGPGTPGQPRLPRGLRPQA